MKRRAFIGLVANGLIAAASVRLFGAQVSADPISESPCLDRDGPYTWWFDELHGGSDLRLEDISAIWPDDPWEGVFVPWVLVTK